MPKSTSLVSLLVCLLFLISNTVHAQVSLNPDGNNILHVNQNVSGGNEDGSSWNNAVPKLVTTLYWASQKIANGEEAWSSSNPLQIWVAGSSTFGNATYVPVLPSVSGILDPGNRDNHFGIGKNIQLYGGFPESSSNGTDMTDRNPATNATILAGNVGNGKSAYHVVLSAFDSGKALLDGFVIYNGNANGSGSINISPVDNPTNTLEVPQNKGGGIYIADSSPLLRNLLILDNTADEGGGIYIGNGGSPTIVNSVLRSNVANNYGGGFYNASGWASIINTIFSDNNDNNSAGAIYNEDTVEMVNSIAWENNGNSVLVDDEITNTGGGTTNINYSIIEGGCSEDLTCSNIIANDPQLVDPADYNFQLQGSSPAINSGDPNSVLSVFSVGTSDPKDFSGNDRVYGSGSIDIGAFEFQNIKPNPFGGGTGNEANPYQISNLNQLQEAKNYPYANFILTSDIDATDTQNWNSNEGFAPIGFTSGEEQNNPFNGKFDGNNHTINNLFINRPGNRQSLFGIIGEHAIVKDLTLTNFDITADSRSGAITGNNLGIIRNVRASGAIRGEQYLGSITGINEETGTIQKSSAKGLLTTTTSTVTAQAGGLVGSNYGRILQSHSSVETVSLTGADAVGGLVGINQMNGTIERSYATGKVLGKALFGTDHAVDAGGLVGLNYGSISQSLSTGAVLGGSSVGGLVGGNKFYETGAPAVITQSYSTGTVTSYSGTKGRTGGLVGENQAIVRHSFSTGSAESATGQNEVGGLIGASYTTDAQTIDSYWDTKTSGLTNSAAGTGLTTSEMRQNSNFSGFDFTNTWEINEGSSLPYLQNMEHRILQLKISGSEDWRMMSAPFKELTYGSMLDTLWTQGFPGSDSPNYGPSNVLSWNEPNQRFKTIANATDTLSQGTGFITYVFDDTNFDSTDDGFPKFINTQGFVDTSSVQLSLSYTNSGVADSVGWNLVGNPYGTTIDWSSPSGWTKTNLDQSFYVWNASASHGAGAYQSWNGSGGTLPNGKIATWQGFWVKANSNAPNLNMTPEIRSSGGVFLKENPIPQIKLELKETLPQASTIETNGQTGLESKTVIMFAEQAQLGNDPLDAWKLKSLNEQYLSLYTTDTERHALDINALPKDIESPLELNLDFRGSDLGGEYTLKWNPKDLPDSWTEGAITLIDLHTDRILNLNKAGEYRFAVKNAKTSNVSKPSKRSKRRRSEQLKNKSRDKASMFEQPHHGPIPTVLKAKAKNPRFVLKINPNVSTAPVTEIPESVELNQNYPNPFNPETVIHYGVPQQAQVQLNVYDVLGRKVRTLINEQKSPGNYEAHFNGRSLSSGLYFYRLKIGTKIITKKMTLIK